MTMADKPHRRFPHDDIEPLAPNLWTVRGSLPFPLKRHMIVYRLGDGTLLIHSGIAMSDDGMAKLEALGRPSVMIVPHSGHRMDAPFYKARYPQIRVLAPAAARAKVEDVIKVDATCEEALPALGVRIHPVPAFKNGELAYELDLEGGGKALIMSDVVANRDHPKGFGGWFFANVTGGIKGRLGVARIMKVMMMTDKAEARAGLEKLAEIPGLTLLSVAHGRPVRDDVTGALREAAAGL
jgi:hypothetical protein